MQESLTQQSNIFKIILVYAVKLLNWKSEKKKFITK